MTTMSRVTGVVLCHTIGENSAIVDEINSWLDARAFGALKQIDQAAGGSKCLEMNVFGAGFNFFGSVTHDFIAFVLSRTWLSPENVVLILQPPEDATMVYRPSYPSAKIHGSQETRT
jgi:hypothetical protein